MRENFLGRVHKTIENFIDSADPRRLGRSMAKTSIRTNNLITKIEEKHPDLKEPNKIDPALKALLEAKVNDGRLSPEDFERELAKYDRE